MAKMNPSKLRNVLEALPYCDLSGTKKEAIATIITKYLTGDIISVVMCKDCKRNEKNGGDCNRTLPITSRDYVLEQNVTEYISLDFCSYGERKDNEKV